MDESLHYLLHEELEGLFDRPAAEAVQVAPVAVAATAAASASPAGAEPAATPAAATAPVSDRTFDELIARLADPKVLQALARLLGGR
ncbi:hypothetical protein [Lysobacter sp. Root690]|uniref:hypothetical protein n=1 Tax=Lysobacter sp. Root690 TaxID=1736588 RepID=UPI0006FB3BE7|nr:hypothetical protein [Lysobacter sp. Root690]KRB03338.1 hypothetical protein ASD86_20885 [Lysobacter sp. Root690]